MAAGMVAPVSLRRTYALTEAKPASRTPPVAEDRFELSPGHLHEDGQTCPICGREIVVDDGITSGIQEGAKGATTGLPPGRGVGSDSRLDPEQQEQLDKLKERDKEVRTHEQAHRATGGQFTGAASYDYQTGPDGRQYAVDGEVSVDLSPVPGNPQATIAKMQQIRRAALAPARPSSQDRRVAAQASRIEAEARAEMAGRRSGEATGCSNTRLPEVAPVRGAMTSMPQSGLALEVAGETHPVGTLLDIAI